MFCLWFCLFYWFNKECEIRVASMCYYPTLIVWKRTRKRCRTRNTRRKKARVITGNTRFSRRHKCGVLHGIRFEYILSDTRRVITSKTTVCPKAMKKVSYLLRVKCSHRPSRFFCLVIQTWKKKIHVVFYRNALGDEKSPGLCGWSSSCFWNDIFFIFFFLLNDETRKNEPYNWPRCCVLYSFICAFHTRLT